MSIKRVVEGEENSTVWAIGCGANTCKPVADVKCVSNFFCNVNLGKEIWVTDLSRAIEKEAKFYWYTGGFF